MHYSVDKWTVTPCRPAVTQNLPVLHWYLAAFHTDKNAFKKACASNYTSFNKRTTGHPVVILFIFELDAVVLSKKKIPSVQTAVTWRRPMWAWPYYDLTRLCLNKFAALSTVKQVSWPPPVQFYIFTHQQPKFPLPILCRAAHNWWSASKCDGWFHACLAISLINAAAFPQSTWIDPDSFLCLQRFLVRSGLYRPIGNCRKTRSGWLIQHNRCYICNFAPVVASRDVHVSLYYVTLANFVYSDQERSEQHSFTLLVPAAG